VANASNMSDVQSERFCSQCGILFGEGYIHNGYDDIFIAFGHLGVTA
jgi:hypothetical protein